MLYNKLSEYLKNKYGERVQRLPINAGFTCPNKIGLKGTSGCIYCEETGSGFAALSPKNSIKEQVEYMIKRYEGRANKYMAYFQSNTNTFAPAHVLKKIYDSALIDDRIVILDISTRPDSVEDEKLDLIASYKEKLDVYLEFGLQSVNYNTLKILNRGHTLAEFIDAVNRAKNRNIEVIVHMIIDLPWDREEDIIEGAKILSALNVDGVKLHSLYITENTVLGQMYKNGGVKPLSLEEFINRNILFLEYLDPKVVIHRLAADPPKDNVIHGNWGMSKIKIINLLEKEMRNRNTYQGRLFNYLNR
ncbi:TIGR01212 family radical SAM protein [Marinitoga sp. 38H-ov]|uniref:TIGR01212 family radical SAM protein n=1 Tax=Marinitoga sp. 38H-ov TaxID=1755814 RepID=UPI0013EAAF15|nr:TIGR01212 family radical SAM protein [Marinitoga sp. 38H-ov]KAF2955980.1 radical SAM protein [Marinitoga sp. 38H-ov]